MSFIYITGLAGSGKTTVCNELVSRGHEAYDADNALSDFYNNDTGELAPRPFPVEKRTPEWRLHHSWKLSREKLLELKPRAADKPLFVCGVAANEYEYIDVFDRIYALSIDLASVTERVKTRTTGDFGKSGHEMQMLIEWESSVNDYYQQIGAHIIDATLPIKDEVDQILASI